MKISGILIQINVILLYYTHGSPFYVNENSTDVLRCPIMAQPYSVYWEGPPNLTRYNINNTINPNLPNKNRLSVVGYEIHNLQISNISKTDIGKYQCTGTDIKNNTSASAAIDLMFAVAPDSGPSLSTNASKPLFAGARIELKCEVIGGFPLANISWQCNGSSDQQNASTTLKTVSIVQLTLAKSNNQSCGCIASHRGWQTPVTAYIFLDVFYAPISNLTIQQIPTGGIISGKNVILTCRASGGNPLATLSWNCTGNTKNDTDGTAVSNSVEFRVDENDNNKICVCSAIHPVETYRPRAQKNIIVYFQPKDVPSIQQTPAGGILTGQQVKLTCTVVGGNPLATLNWNCTGTKTNNKTVDTASYSIEYVVNKTQDNTMCGCSAEHAVASYRPTVVHKLVVFYAPDKSPDILQTPHGGIIAGQTVRLTCAVSGGNPLATLKWNCNGTSINTTSNEMAEYSIDLTVNKNDNNRLCLCIATHRDSKYNRTAQHRLIVYYAPDTNLSIEQNPLGGIITGYNVTLTCFVSGGNPLATLTWDCDGVRANHTSEMKASYSIELVVNKTYNNKICTCVGQHAVQTYKPSIHHKMVVFFAPDINPVIQQKPTGGIISGNNVTLICSVDGGNPRAVLHWNCTGDMSNSTTVKTAKYTVEFTVNRNQNEDICTCSAIHPVDSYTPVVQHRLDVYFSPDVSVNRDLSDIVEGKDLKLHCNANGNPSQYSYGWKHIFRDQVIRTIEKNTSILLLPNLSYQDFGHYKCIVNNGIKDQQGRLNQTNGTEIEVKYKPVFTHLKKDTTAKAGRNITTAVDFFAFPDINRLVQWTHSTTNSTVVNSTILITTLHRKTVNISVYEKNVSIDTFSYQSALQFPKFEADQAGFYILQINNDVGGNNISLQIVLSDLPNPPTQFTASVIGSTTVTLAWTRGFNGGNQQTFIITYWDINSFNKRTRNVTEISDQNDYEEIIPDLLPLTTYVFIINSTNVEGISDPINNTVVFKTEGISETTSSIIGPVGGSIGGAVVIILIIVVVVFIFRKQSGKLSKTTDRKNLTFKSREEEDEDGLQINDLYVSADDSFNQCTRPGDVYAVVEKSKRINSEAKQNTQETVLYAEVNKRKDPPIKGKLGSNTQNEKKLKVNKKGENKIERPRNDDVYENMSDQHHGHTSEMKNKDGLVYADLVFNDEGKRKFVIRGIENKTNYADIDLSIKVDPLPSDESDTEDEQLTKSTDVVPEIQ